jgi:SAM-dependent methyltransferase
MPVPYEEIITVNNDRYVWPERRVFMPVPTAAPDILSPEHDAWQAENRWLLNYCTDPEHKQEAESLAAELQQLYSKMSNTRRIEEVHARLRQIRLLPFEHRTSLQQWSHMLAQKPGDMGGGFDNWFLTQYLSERVTGRVMEAMCGFNSYLLPARNRRVIAVDYCREGLERYVYPKRRRILLDLDAITGAEDFAFLKGRLLDAITICFGYKYLADPERTFRGFREILRPGGRLCLIEHPYHHYESIANRGYCAQTLKKQLLKAGYSAAEYEKISFLPRCRQFSSGNYYYTVGVR